MTLNADSITVNDNYIGLNLAGRADGNRGNGIFVAADSSSDLIDGSAHDNTIGGDTASVIPQNTFSGNHGYGAARTATPSGTPASRS